VLHVLVLAAQFSVSTVYTLVNSSQQDVGESLVVQSIKHSKTELAVTASCMNLVD